MLLSIARTFNLVNKIKGYVFMQMLWKCLLDEIIIKKLRHPSNPLNHVIMSLMPVTYSTISDDWKYNVETLNI